MSRLLIPVLSFANLPVGNHETPLDLRVLLFKGGSKANRKHAIGLITAGKLGEPIEKRVPLVVKLHDILSAAIVRGGSKATLTSSVECCRRLYSFADASNLDPVETTMRDIF